MSDIGDALVGLAIGAVVLGGFVAVVSYLMQGQGEAAICAGENAQAAIAVHECGRNAVCRREVAEYYCPALFE